MADLDDQIILVTGATAGLGYATALALAKRGAHVVLLARNAAKAAEARAAISAAAGHPRVDVLLADVADLEQVRRVAAELNARYPRLDVLINNAGVLPAPTRRLSAQGYELGLATNHLGPFLLTALLFDKLRQSPAARIINVSSAMYQRARPDLTDFQAERRYSSGGVYGNTKLYNILFTQELARRLRQHGIGHVVTHALHPGVVATDFSKGVGGWMSFAARLARPFALSPEQGAATILFLATDPAALTSSGGYFVKEQRQPVQQQFNTPENAQRLWELSEELTGERWLT